MRRFVLAAAVAVGGLIVAGAATANTVIRYTMTGTIVAGGGDSAGLNGATITGQMDYDSTQAYINSFGFAALPTIIGSERVTISGAPNGANNTTTPYNSQLAFYPTFAGTFSHPAGQHTDFTAGGGALMQFTMNTIPTAGSGNAVIGSLPELDDFVPASGSGNSLINLGTGEGYTLNNVVIDAYKVPAPGALALLGVAGLVSRRRRR